MMALIDNYPDNGSESYQWLASQPTMPESGKVDGKLLIEESRRRGYCVCPKPMRQVIDFNGLTCSWCGQIESDGSRDFWYGKRG